MRELISQCKEKIGDDVEQGKTFGKAVIIKKKHYFGITAGGTFKVVGMEGKKNDRPVWVNRTFDRFLEDFKDGVDPTVKLKAAVSDLEGRRIDPELLKVRVKLTKNPDEYSVNNPNKRIGTLVEAMAGDVIWYFKTDDKQVGVFIKPEDIGIKKHKEMLMATVKDALEIMGYGTAGSIESEIFGMTEGKSGRNRRIKYLK